MAGWRKRKEPKLNVPYAPSGESKGRYFVNALEEKMVSDFSGYDFDRIENLSIFEFWALLHDAVVYNCQQTEEGRKYLNACWLHSQTEPDRGALQKYFGKGTKSQK